MGMNGRSHVDDYERVLKPCVNLASVMLPKFPVDFVHREFIRVEPATAPYHYIIVILVVWVSDRFEELGIARDASHILRWACSCPFDAAGILDLRLWFQDFLKEDLMLPGVPEVILVNEPDLPSRLGDLADRNPLLVSFFHLPFPIFVIEGSVVFPPDNELVQMAILPAHDHLKDFVKFPQRAIRHLNPPPYRWVALFQRELELIDRS